MSYRNSSSNVAIGAAVIKKSTLRMLLAPVIAFFLMGALMIFGGRTMSADSSKAVGDNKSLIYCGWYGAVTPTPSYIQDNFAFLESQPFNGLAVYMRNPSMSINASTAVTSSAPISYEAISSVLAPIANLNFVQLKDNFAVVFGGVPPDFFDNWTTTIQNFSNLAAAVRDAGLRGIIFDNEQYSAPWGNYPEGVAYPGTSLQAYEDQANLRGKQVMQAMTAQFPGIVVVTLHGPYVSEPDAPWSLMFPQWQSGNELLGPFFAGFQEGAVTPGQNVDGGELYDLRTASQFNDSYNWRKYDLPSDQVDSTFISSSIRGSWSNNVSISFGVYDCPFLGQPMSPAVLTPTLQNAVARADRWVWYYAEQATYLLPPGQGGASTEWVEAVRAALPAGTTDEGEFGGGSLTGSGGGSGSSRCGLLGIEVVPIVIGLALLRARRRNQSK